MTAMLSSDLPLPKIGRGKVRDIYAVDDDRLLLVTTDRISAFDVVMGETIPMKGAVLTQISAFWFNELEGVVPHHMISADADEIIAAVPALKPHRAEILGRAMLSRRTTVFPIECVIRGYLSGSAWKEYAASGTLAGEKLKEGLVESEKLEPSIFSPATKAETGHDENITIAKMREVVGDEVAYTLESMTRAVYTLGEELAREQGIIIAGHQVRVRPRQGRPHHPDRRSHDARQLTLLGGRCLQARPAAGELRQAAFARLSRRRAPRRPLERRRAAAPAARQRRGCNQQALSRSLQARDGERAEDLSPAVSSRSVIASEAKQSRAAAPHPEERALCARLEGRGHQRGLHPSRRAFRAPQDEEHTDWIASLRSQ
ncbi:phosphoribosylaminoimidazole-succinocarboxamide synthase [Bradyrhizobium sp. i1.4.4]